MDFITPTEDEEARRKARSKARAAASTGDWLSLVLQHHAEIEAAFIAVKSSRDADQCADAQSELALLLTGHANAEESVLYPALVRAGEKGHAGTAYSEQAEAKTQMAALEVLKPLSGGYLEKLEHIRTAVTHHMYEEESRWFLALKEQLPPQQQAKLTQRFREEFDRYVGGDRSSIARELRHYRSSQSAYGGDSPGAKRL
jgi:hypothetical protein